MRAAICFTMILLAGTRINGGESLKMSVSPQQSFAPANLFVRVAIEPNTANRAVEVVAESDDFYRSSLVTLEGENGPRTVLLQFRNLPGGQYDVTSRVTNQNGHEVASAHSLVNVVSSGR